MRVMFIWDVNSTNMTPQDVYSYIDLHDLTFNFAGILPSSGLQFFNSDNLNALSGVCFLIFLPDDIGLNGHYIALLCCDDHCELFDPLGYPAIVDHHLTSFMTAHICFINLIGCQSPHLECCGVLCIYYLYLRYFGFNSSVIIDTLIDWPMF